MPDPSPPEPSSLEQHLAAPGPWAVGAHFDPAAVAWEVGVIALHGVNLFKLAPEIGQVLAAAALDGSLPESTLTG